MPSMIPSTLATLFALVGHYCLPATASPTVFFLPFLTLSGFAFCSTTVFSRHFRYFHRPRKRQKHTFFATTSPLLLLVGFNTIPFTCTMASPYTWLTDVRVQFLPHPGRANAHKSLNDLYSDVLPRLDDLFVDSSRTAVHPDIITILRTKLVNDLIVPHATLTPNPDVVIPPLIQGCFYKLRWTANTHGGTRLRDAQSFATALLDAHSAGKTDVDVLVGINHLHFDPQHEPISYLNWEAISNTPFPSPTTVRPPTASDIASAFTRSLPSVDELGLAIANAFAAVQGNTSTTGAPYSTSASPSLSGLSSSIFNPGNLPTDVLDRYQRHRDNKVFTPALLTQFDGGFFYRGVDENGISGLSYHRDAATRKVEGREVDAERNGCYSCSKEMSEYGFIRSKDDASTSVVTRLQKMTRRKCTGQHVEVVEKSREDGPGAPPANQQQQWGKLNQFSTGAVHNGTVIGL